MALMLLGPFRGFAQGRNGRIIFYSGSELHPKDHIALDASRILRVYKHNDQYYVVYQTDNEDYYRPFLTMLPSEAEEHDKLVYRKQHVKCIDDYCPKECLADPWYDPACSDYVSVTYEDVVLWERPNVYIGSVIDMQVGARDLVRWRAVTSRNVDAVAKGLAEWDGRGWMGTAGREDWPSGKVVDVITLKEPFYRLYLMIDAKLETSDWDYCCDEKPVGNVVVLVYEGMWTYALYKRFENIEDARKFFDELKRLFEETGWIAEELEEKKKEEEERRLDREEVINEILSRLPEWADAAYIREECWMGAEEGECVTEVYPAKRSKYGNGWYFSKSWRTIYVRDAEKIGIDIVVLRDGKIVKVKERKNGRSKYITLLPAD